MWLRTPLRKIALNFSFKVAGSFRFVPVLNCLPYNCYASLQILSSFSQSSLSFLGIRVGEYMPAVVKTFWEVLASLCSGQGFEIGQELCLLSDLNRIYLN